MAVVVWDVSASTERQAEEALSEDVTKLDELHISRLLFVTRGMLKGNRAEKHINSGSR